MTRQALKEILEDSYASEVDEYLGRGWYERRSERPSGIIAMARRGGAF